MSAVLIDGKSVAAKLNSETAAKVAELAAKGAATANHRSARPMSNLRFNLQR